MREPIWLTAKDVLAFHDEQLALYGGLAGVRDFNLLESALAKPRMAWNYEEPQPDIITLAATLMVGMARNHPFNDANKRTALVAGLTFLALNGYDPDLNAPATVEMMVAVASGEMGVE
ncbi:MAG: type II toxin-antitoxin system death-on-curing family toxin, partial [Proteobacteria bacterium]|nr:type II toxin-antitoxin system death-on-curing family toxin [Pseudomonadota bacterium]